MFLLIKNTDQELFNVNHKALIAQSRSALSFISIGYLFIDLSKIEKFAQ